MKILTRKSQDKAGKILTAMLVILNSGKVYSPDVYSQMFFNIADLAEIVGGIKMVEKVGNSAINIGRVKENVVD